MKDRSSGNEQEEYLCWCEELKEWQENDEDQRAQARECDAFLLDKDGQWEDSIREALENQKRPRYTFDKITPVIETIMAEIEGMDFSVNVKPASGVNDKDLAETYEGMIRSIENQSRADSLYRNALRRVMRRGFDAWRVRSRYTDDWSFDQDLVIEPIPNALNRVWVSSSCVKQDSSDTTSAYVLTSMSMAKYKDKFPNGSGISVDVPTHNADSFSNSRQPDVIIIGERYYKKESTIEIAQLSNGEVIKVDDKFNSVIDELKMSGVTVVRTKKIKDPTWCYRVFDGGGFLSEEMPTPFKSCPVITVYGNYEITGENSKITYSGITLKLIDAQRVHNYAKSREIEEGALAPRPKLFMTQRQAAGHERQIARMNISSDPVQFYNPDEQAQPPYYAGGAQVNGRLEAISANAQADIQAQASVSDSLMGNVAGRQSEESIRMQVDRGTAVTRKWINAIIDGIRQTGQVLVEAIPSVYDTKRLFNIMNQDGTEEQITLNHEVYDVQSGTVVKLNDLSQGRYRIVCDAGPAFSNKLEAGLSALLEYAKIDPSVIAIGGDIMLRSIDAPLIDKIAERKRADMLEHGLIPPSQMTDDEKQQMMEKMQQVDPIAQAAMLEGQARLMEGQAAIQNEINDANKILIDKQRADNDTARVQIQAAEAGVKIQKTHAEATAQQMENDFNAATGMMHKR